MRWYSIIYVKRENDQNKSILAGGEKSVLDKVDVLVFFK